jgi:DNA-binding CsgD family transcriptional regulator
MKNTVDFTGLKEEKIKDLWTRALGFKNIIAEPTKVKVYPRKLPLWKNPLNQKKYYLGKSHPDIHLTQREAECMWIILIGDCTYLEIAKYLNLSVRTVEVYMDKLKQKMSAKNKADLIRIIKETDFVINTSLLGIELRMYMNKFINENRNASIISE